MNASAAAVVQAGNTLGEGIIWCSREQALYWTDIHAATLWRFRPRDARTDQWAMPERLACLALCEADGWLLLGLASRLAFFHPASGTLVPIASVETGLPTRLNDGACDRQGRFVFGTLHEPPAGGPRKPLGSFYRLNADLSLERLDLPGVAISNSIAFSPDGGTLYYCDTSSGTIQCCEYDQRCGPSRTFTRLDDPRGGPDGSTVDAAGNLWNAQWGLGRVACYTADGRLDHCIEIPASQPTRPAFGGSDLAMLYVTSARDGLDAAVLAFQPSAGAVFAIPAGTIGLPEARFAGPTPGISTHTGATAADALHLASGEAQP